MKKVVGYIMSGLFLLAFQALVIAVGLKEGNWSVLFLEGFCLYVGTALWCMCS